jgi:Flp pilus assembly protein TadG
MKRSRRLARRGAIAPLTAVLLIPLVGMMAFSLDIGWISHTQNELQSAADAAALAGAAQLTDNFVAYYLPKQTGAQQTTLLNTAKDSARASAKAYAGYNTAGGVNSLTLLDSDIEFGFTDAAGKYTPLSTYTGYPNTVKVVLRRDTSANTPLSLFFGPVIGTSQVSLTATAAATIQAGTIDSFTTSSSLNAHILPMTFDINHWNNFLQTGKSPDGNKDNGTNGYAQLDVYPSIKYAGNFGELSLDQGSDGSSTISNWISNGVTSTDLMNETAAGLLPLSTHNPLGPPDYTTLAPDWKGNSGLKESTIQAVGNYVNQVFLLPLFKPVNNGVADPTAYQAGVYQGTNYAYTVVQFVSIKITSVDTSGNNKAITVQPYASINPTAIFSSLAPATPPTASSPLITTFSAPKLTQ